jgi:hypothetical protein
MQVHKVRRGRVGDAYVGEPFAKKFGPREREGERVFHNVDILSRKPRSTDWISLNELVHSSGKLIYAHEEAMHNVSYYRRWASADGEIFSAVAYYLLLNCVVPHI